MKIKEIATLVSAVIAAGQSAENEDCIKIFASDLMSDVLAFAKDEDILISGLCNPQVVRTAALLDMRCIILVRGKVPTDEILGLCNKKEIAILTTELGMHEVCGILYAHGLSHKEK